MGQHPRVRHWRSGTCCQRSWIPCGPQPGGDRPRNSAIAEFSEAEIARIREPKAIGRPPVRRGAKGRIARGLRDFGIPVRDYYISIEEYRKYFAAAKYPE